MKRIFYDKAWLWIYCALNILFCIVSAFFMKNNYNCVVPIYMWMPTWWIIILKKTDSIKRIIVKTPSLTEVLFSATIGIALILLPYVLYALVFKKTIMFNNLNSMWVIQIFIDIITTSLLVMGEEIAWRGVLYEELKVITTKGKAISFVGIIWIVWHIPLVISGDYLYNKIRLDSIFFFIVNAMLINRIFFIIKEYNFINLILIHSTLNVMESYRGELIILHKNAQYYIGETGLFTTISWFFMILLYKAIQRKDVKKGKT